MTSITKIFFKIFLINNKSGFSKKNKIIAIQSTTKIPIYLLVSKKYVWFDEENKPVSSLFQTGGHIWERPLWIHYCLWFSVRSNENKSKNVFGWATLVENPEWSWGFPDALPSTRKKGQIKGGLPHLWKQPNVAFDEMWNPLTNIAKLFFAPVWKSIIQKRNLAVLRNPTLKEDTTSVMAQYIF